MLRPVCEVGSSKDDAGDPPLLNIKLTKLSYLPKTSKPSSVVQLPVDILLLTVEDCEFLACHYYLRNVFRSYFQSFGYAYFGDMQGDDQQKPLKVALVKCSKGSSDPGSSLIVAKNAVTQLRPKVTFAVGHCKGLNHEKVKLGDVVISSRLTTDAYKTPVSRDVGNLVRNAAHGWKAPLENPKAQEIKVHCDGEILSCPDPLSAEQQHSGTIAVEMEGKGLFTAAHDMKSEWVVVKGVSHFADGSPHEPWEIFASVMAASVVSNILSDPYVFEQWPHYEDTSAQQEGCLKIHSKRGLPCASTSPDAKRSRLGEMVQRYRNDYRLESELPEEPLNIHGHETEVDEVVKALSDDSNKAVAAVLVSGIAGIGKTTVAIQAGHRIKDESCSIVKFCSLRYADSGEKKSELVENNGERELREILNVCVPGHQQTNEFPRHVLLNWCRQLDHELILVLDNAEDAMGDDVGSFLTDLLKEMRKCSRCKIKFLITSRRSEIDRSTGLNVKTIKVGPLGLEESIEVLKNGATLQSESEGMYDKLDKIAVLCELIPLALQLAAPLLSSESEYTVDELIQELQNNPTKTLRCDRMMEIVFEKLNEPLKHALVCLSVFVRSFDKNAAKALLGVKYVEYLTKLKERCLIEKQDDRYLIHVLIRSYARQVGKAKLPQILAYGHQTFLEYFLSLILRNAKIYWGKDTCKDSFDLFNAERLNYESTLRFVSDKKIRDCRELEDVVNQCRLVAPYIRHCVHIKLYENVLKGLLHFAESQIKVISRVEILCLLYHEGMKCGSAKKEIQDEAIELHDDNSSLFEEDGLAEVFYWIYHGRYLSQDCNQREQAQPLLKKALSRCNKKDPASTFDKARILEQMGHNAKELGRTDQACEYYLEALKLLRFRYGNHSYTAFAHKDVADYYLHVGQFPLAEENYQKAIDILEDIKIADHKEAILIFKNWGICLEKNGKCGESREKYVKGSDIADNTIEGNHKWKVWIKTYLALLLYNNYQDEVCTADRMAKEALQMGNQLKLQDWPREKELEEMYKKSLEHC